MSSTLPPVVNHVAVIGEIVAGDCMDILIYSLFFYWYMIMMISDREKEMQLLAENQLWNRD